MSVTVVCLSHSHFHSSAQCKCATVGLHPTVWKFSTITLPTCTLQAAKITQRNTRRVLECDYRRHTQLATQLKGQGEIQNHSG